MSLNKKFNHLKIELRAIKNATNNFANCIGEGGFGKVFKGELKHSEGNTTVAIKILDRKFGQGDPEFWKEIMLLSHYRHPNVASLLGFCDQGREKILVYEYASRRSLDNYLGGDLTWVQRLNICIGAAHGLAYLHNPDGSQQRVLHRDIKSSNILLDDNWKAMISDFGLSKIGPANQQDTFLVSQAVGTAGYCDPNYMATGLLTKESDVYSFGVVLFEVFCGRLMSTRIDKSSSLTRLARDHYEQNKMKDIIHEKIKDEINPDSMNVFTRIAYQCLDGDYEKRPLMTEVVYDLEDALQFQENKRVIIKGDLLTVKPQELHFPFELMKEISSSIQLKNRTYSHVAFKVKSTRPNTYAALPHDGILLPQSTCQIKITMQPQKEDPDHDMRCNDKFMVQSAVVSPGVPKVITRELFNKESGNQVGECKLDVSFVAPKKPLLRLIEGGPKEDVLPTTSISDAGTVNLSNSNSESGNQVDECKLSVKYVAPHQPPSSVREAQKKVLSKSGNIRNIYDEVYGESSFNAYIQENSKGACMGELLSIEPPELQFPFELMKESSTSLQLKNITDSHVAFKVKTTKPDKYAADPTTGILLPFSARDISFTMQAQKAAPQDMECSDKYLLQSAVVSPGFLLKDITRELFNKESGNQVEACVLNVKYVAPHQPPSSVREARKKVFSKSANIQHIRYDENDFHSF